jgi:hypothetical protein
VADDPFAVLGLDARATLAEVRAARRRLAFELHPDRGGDADGMRRLNLAFEQAVAHVTGRVVHEAGRPASSSDPAPGASTPPPGPSAPTAARATRRRPVRWVERDEPSFTVDRLPAEAFEALAIVATWLGEVLVDDPPYVLEVHLYDPAPCWCRLELLPEAGGSIVNLVVAGVDQPPPPIDDVRDRWVSALNQLGNVESDG